MSKDRKFEGDDLRKHDLKFQGKTFKHYLETVEKLDKFAQENYNKRVIHLTVCWMLDQGISTALWGTRRPDQLDAIDEISGWDIREDAKTEIDKILQESIKYPVGLEFMGPP